MRGIVCAGNTLFNKESEGLRFVLLANEVSFDKDVKKGVIFRYFKGAITIFCEPIIFNEIGLIASILEKS